MCTTCKSYTVNCSITVMCKEVAVTSTCWGLERERDVLSVKINRRRGDGWLRNEAPATSAFGTHPISLDGWVACRSALQNQSMSAATPPGAPLILREKKKNLATESSFFFTLHVACLHSRDLDQRTLGKGHTLTSKSRSSSWSSRRSAVFYFYFLLLAIAAKSGIVVLHK